MHAARVGGSAPSAKAGAGGPVAQSCRRPIGPLQTTPPLPTSPSPSNQPLASQPNAPRPPRPVCAPPPSLQISSEFGSPREFLQGFDPAKVPRDYGSESRRGMGGKLVGRAGPRREGLARGALLARGLAPFVGTRARALCWREPWRQQRAPRKTCGRPWLLEADPSWPPLPSWQPNHARVRLSRPPLIQSQASCTCGTGGSTRCGRQLTWVRATTTGRGHTPVGSAPSGAGVQQAANARVAAASPSCPARPFSAPRTWHAAPAASSVAKAWR
jgi:hypothetical protein